MNCQETQEIIHGYLDGELDVVHNLAVEQHLQQCAACARSVQGQQVLRKAIAGSFLYFQAPKGLEQRLLSAVRQSKKADLGTSLWRWTGNWPIVLAPLGAVALLLLLGVPWAMRTSTEDRLSQEIVSAHVRSLMANHLTDVTSTDQHTVKPWFNGRLPFSPPVNDPSAQDFSLIGGRLDYVENHPVAALVYQHRKHFINVFIWPSTLGSNTSEKHRTLQGYNAIHWNQGAMEYWAVSDMNLHDLRDFEQLLRSGSTSPSGP